MRSSIIEQEILQIPTAADTIDVEDYLFKEQFEAAVEQDIYTIRMLGQEVTERLVTCKLPADAPFIRSGVTSEVVGDTIGRFANGSRDVQRLDNLYHDCTPRGYDIAITRTPMHLNLGKEKDAIETTLPLVTFTKTR